VTGKHPDPSLATHLRRVSTYVDGTGLLDDRYDRPDLRRALASLR